MFTVKMAKSNFFDRKTVTDRVDKAVVKNLSKWGAYVRTDARSSLRYRKRPSEPGKPPSVHRSKTMKRTKTNKKGVTTTQGVSPLRENVLFAYDDSSRSAVVGPAKIPGKIGNAPQALEHGGTSQVRSFVWEKGKRIATTAAATIHPRPFMVPAAERTNKKLPEIWANSVKR